MADQLGDFLARAGHGEARLFPLAGDASARRYSRLCDRAGRPLGWLLLDARAVPETCPPFVDIAGQLRDLGLSAPDIAYGEPAAGLLLVEDFGDDLFAGHDGDPPRRQALYDLAVDLLSALHARFDVRTGGGLPRFDADRFLTQSRLYLREVTPTADPRAFERALEPVLEAATAVPESLLLRDFHTENLVWLPDRPGVAACGLLDFQDAGVGPVVYDLVSLLEDARRDVPSDLRARSVDRFLQGHAGLDRATFDAAFSALAVLRHLRVIAIFHRLTRQGRAGYDRHLPRIRGLLRHHLGMPGMAELRDWLDGQADTQLQ